MAIFNSKLLVYQRVSSVLVLHHVEMSSRPGLCCRCVLGICVAGGGQQTAAGRPNHSPQGRGDADPGSGKAKLRGENPRLVRERGHTSFDF